MTGGSQAIALKKLVVFPATEPKRNGIVPC
jgi:hypothetical protein